jgi:hypothetical protein
LFVLRGANDMEITDYAIGTAVLNQFRDARVYHAGGSLLLRDLRRAWPETGLRARDFERAIEVLGADGYAVVKDAGNPEDRVLTLLPKGSDRLTNFPWTFTGITREIGAAMALRAAARRPRPEAWLKLRSRLHHFEPERRGTA